MEQQPLELVRTLKSQHDRILACLSAFRSGCPSMGDVAVFGELLTAHLNLENERFYPLLFEREAVSSDMAAGFRSTMDSLVRAAGKFIKKWSNTAPSIDPASFSFELDVLTRHLRIRFGRGEEKLYGLVLSGSEKLEYDILRAGRDFYADTALGGDASGFERNE